MSRKTLALCVAAIALGPACHGTGHQGRGERASDEARGGHGGHSGHSGHADDATVRHRFEDAELWASRFEDPERDAWQQPERVVELLGLAPDARVADVGAATGYFPVRFARAVPRGVVYGVDVEPTLVNYLNVRARREGLTNLVSLVCAYDDPRLPEPVDLVFVCNTYHHIDDRVAYFTRVRQRDLRPGGRLAIVDYVKGDLPVGPRDDHKLAPERVVEELERAGYRKVEQHGLPYQYLLVFTPR